MFDKLFMYATKQRKGSKFFCIIEINPLNL